MIITSTVARVKVLEVLEVLDLVMLLVGAVVGMAVKAVVGAAQKSALALTFAPPNLQFAPYGHNSH
jgi:uncharacterized protein YejL (UPF0352 family)